MTHELVVEHVERATPRPAVMVLQQNEQLQLFLELVGINHGDVPAIVGQAVQFFFHPWLGAIEGKLSFLPEHPLKQSLALLSLLPFVICGRKHYDRKKRLAFT